MFLERYVHRLHVCIYYLFYNLEERGLLSPSDEIDLFSLHYAFLARINNHLEIFCQAYNRHRLRTEGNHSPMQLWLQGMLATDDDTAASGVYNFEELSDVRLYIPYARVCMYTCSESGIWISYKEDSDHLQNFKSFKICNNIIIISPWPII